jgi:hypothetical protein
LALFFRDVVQYILPTVVALALFLPFFKADVSIEVLAAAGVLLGYLVSSPVGKLAAVADLPIFMRTKDRYKKERDFWQNNFDYGELWHRMSGDEREYLYTTNSYAEFYYMVAFYLSLYGVINIGVMSWAVSGVGSFETAAFWPAVEAALNARTPMYGGWSAPACVLLAISAVIAFYATRDYLTEFRILFLTNGRYVTFAGIHHEQCGTIARAVWGRVSSSGSSVASAEVTLVDDQGKTIATVKTDSEGRFQFKSLYRSLLGGEASRRCLLRVETARVAREQEIVLRAKQVPRFDVELPVDGTPAEPGGIDPAARRIERASITLCIAALVMIFQPFSLALYGIGAGIVVLGGLACNLVALSQTGTPPR